MRFASLQAALIAGVLSQGVSAQAAPCAPTCPPPAITVAADSIALIGSPADTVKRKRVRSVELSEWYYRRLMVHRVVSYAVIPVFAAQWAAGNTLFPDPRNAPTWSKTTMDAGADALMGMFTVNTVTGLWNLWDSRSVEKGRWLRVAHATMMLTADGIFSYAGSTVAKQAETSLEKRRLHRTLAFTGMGITMSSALMMRLFNK